MNHRQIDVLASRKAVASAIFMLCVVLALVLLGGCTPAHVTPESLLTATERPGEQVLSADEIATLNSLEQVDDYPLYTMRYVGDYPQLILSATSLRLSEVADPITSKADPASWGCTLFAALGDPGQRLYGRNFDWRFSPALALFTNPTDGYASFSMVDIEYLGFEGNRAKELAQLPLEERQALLEAPALPFDGMNEKGLAIGMAAVPPGEMRPDPAKKTIDQLAVMREILDHAGTVDEAVKILGSYNIDMGSVPLHYLIANATGDSALVEFYQGKMRVFRNEPPWQLATNFLVAATDGRPQGQCPRYDRISQRLQQVEGQLTSEEALRLLAEVSQGGPGTQSSTQWSVVYDMTRGVAYIIMGRKYEEGVHTLNLSKK
jgi:hypothetical protein